MRKCHTDTNNGFYTYKLLIHENESLLCSIIECTFDSTNKFYAYTHTNVYYLYYIKITMLY